MGELWAAPCIKNLSEALIEGAQSMEDIGGFVEQRQVDQFIRDVRKAAEQLLIMRDRLS
jgi:5-deoxy-D-glucuronate isomerase